MGVPDTTTRTRLGIQLATARAHTDSLFRMVQGGSFYERPVTERHRIIFYLGHLEAFDWNQICLGALSVPSFNPEFDRLFAFGIDPEPGQLPSDRPSQWPPIDDIRRYNARVRKTVDEVLNEAPEPILHVALEHRWMHAETFAYLLHNLPPSHKVVSASLEPPAAPTPDHAMLDIPGGVATLGQRRGPGRSFGWDNEFDAHEARVTSFSMSKYKVTNGQYLDFVRAGAAPPHFWSSREGHWFWRTIAGEVPLPLDWPVYVTFQEAQAYATWAGKSLPTEAQFHRAAYGTPHDGEQPYPWGTAAPDSHRGNFDFHRWDPVSVTATPMGDSAFGVSQLVGNGWEWTSTVFHPFPGFQPFRFYPGYSAPFFDSDHYVLKGASPRTAVCFLRPSFRNWFRPTYRYVFASFRLVEN